jgi:hypothetical protein
MRIAHYARAMAIHVPPSTKLWLAEQAAAAHVTSWEVEVMLPFVVRQELMDVARTLAINAPLTTLVNIEVSRRTVLLVTRH